MELHNHLALLQNMMTLEPFCVPVVAPKVGVKSPQTSPKYLNFVCLGAKEPEVMPWHHKNELWACANEFACVPHHFPTTIGGLGAN